MPFVNKVPQRTAEQDAAEAERTRTGTRTRRWPARTRRAPASAAARRRRRPAASSPPPAPRRPAPGRRRRQRAAGAAGAPSATRPPSWPTARRRRRRGAVHAEPGGRSVHLLRAGRRLRPHRGRRAAARQLAMLGIDSQGDRARAGRPHGLPGPRRPVRAKEDADAAKEKLDDARRRIGAGAGAALSLRSRRPRRPASARTSRNQTMNRRDFSAAPGAGLRRRSACRPRAGPGRAGRRHGTTSRLSQPVPVAPAGKIEVIEFFWYGCPHCNAFEPALEAWAKKLPADVAFRRVPVGLPRRAVRAAAAPLLRARGDGPARRRCTARCSHAIHVERQRLRQAERHRRLHAEERRRRAPSSWSLQLVRGASQGAPGRASWPTPTRSTACRRSACTAATTRRGTLAGSAPSAALQWPTT